MDNAIIELLKIVALGPVTVLLIVYVLRLHKELGESEKQHVASIKSAEEKRVADVQAYQQKLEALIDKFYGLMMKQGESLEAFDGTLRDHTREFSELRSDLHAVKGLLPPPDRDGKRGGR